LKTATTSRAVLFAGVAALAAAAVWWDRPAPALLTSAQVAAMLPAGSTVHSLVRLEMDGRPPAEAAVVARLPAFPGSREVTSVAMLFRYDRWRRRFARVYAAPPPGTVPFSADAAALLDGRDAAVFSGLHDDGSTAYRIVALAGARPAVVRERRFTGTLVLAEPLLIEQGAQVAAFRWTGRSWAAQPLPSTAAGVPPAVTWRYGVRNGAVVARTAVVHLRPRQPLRVVAVGGGATSVVLPDPRLDVVEAGFRQRHPGTYTIRIVTGFTPVDQAYVLTVVVAP